MKKRKIITLILAVCLIAALGAGATLAYFSDQAETSNVITTGNVDIRLVETPVMKNAEGDYIQNDKAMPIEEGLVFEDVMPGDTLPKDPTVVLNDGSHDAYVRVRMSFVLPGESTITAEDIEVLKQDIQKQIAAGGKWYYNEADDYYYYNAALTLSGTDEEAAATLFDEVTIPGSWKNNTAKQSFQIQLQAEAIQSENLDGIIESDPVSGLITSWGSAAADSDLAPVTP